MGFNSFDTKAPCKDCPDRHRACHDTCEKYKQFKDARRELFLKKLEYDRSCSANFRSASGRGYDGMMRAFTNYKYERKKKDEKGS